MTSVYGKNINEAMIGKNKSKSSLRRQKYSQDASATAGARNQAATISVENYDSLETGELATEPVERVAYKTAHYKFLSTDHRGGFSKKLSVESSLEKARDDGNSSMGYGSKESLLHNRTGVDF